MMNLNLTSASLPYVEGLLIKL